MSEEFDLYELKQMIEEQKERIDTLVRLQKLQGLSLKEIDIFTLSFTSGRDKFLDKIKDLLGCSDEALEKISKELPNTIEYKLEKYQKGNGYYDLSCGSEKDQLDSGYEFFRKTIKESYEERRGSEHIYDDRDYGNDFLSINLSQCLSKEELSSVSSNVEEWIILKGGFRDGKFVIEIDVEREREPFQIYSVDIFDSIKMKKYVYLDDQSFLNYFERTYYKHESDLGFYWRRNLKDFVAKKTQNISQIKQGMTLYEVQELLGDPVLKYPKRDNFYIEFYWIDVPWPNESKDDDMVPVVFQEKTVEKIDNFDAGVERVFVGYGWDYLESVLKMETTDKQDGLDKEYYLGGQLKEERIYKDGKIDGLCKTYYRSGKLKIEKTYRDGMVEGIVSHYFENGNLKQEGAYKNNRPDGPYKVYYENGNLRQEAIFKDDKLIIEKSYDEQGNPEIERK